MSRSPSTPPTSTVSHHDATHPPCVAPAPAVSIVAKRPIEAWRNVQQNILLMDRLYEASFMEWVRCEANAPQAAPHLQRLIPEYGPERVANGLRWLFIDWRLISIATLLREVLFDEATGMPVRGDVEEIIQRITFDWRREHVEELRRFLPPF